MDRRDMVERELQILSATFDRACGASLELFDLTMRMHGLTKAERLSNLDAELLLMAKRRATLLAEAQRVLEASEMVH